MSEYNRMLQKDLKQAAIQKAKDQGYGTTLINQKGNSPKWIAWLENDTWDDSWGVPVASKSKPISLYTPVQHRTEILSEQPIPTPPAHTHETVTKPEDDYPSFASNTTIPVKPSLLGQIAVSIFHRVSDKTPKTRKLDQGGLIRLLTERDVRTDRDGRLFSPAMFDSKREKGDVISISGLCLDFDHGQPTVEQARRIFPDSLMVYYSTHSHCWRSKYSKKHKTEEDQTYTPEHPRFRVFIPYSRSVTAVEHDSLVEGVKSIIPAELMDCIDKSCFQVSRIHYLPSCIPEHEQYAFSGHMDGNPLDVDHFINLGGIAVLPVKPPLHETSGGKKIEIPSDQKWFAQVKPLVDVVSPAWKKLAKSSTDILIICKAKSGASAKKGVKDNQGRPIFEFTQAEAVREFGFTPPTFTAAIRQLTDYGFIVKHRKGGMENGISISNQYRLSDGWESWQAPPKEKSNLEKWRDACKAPLIGSIKPPLQEQG